MNDLLFSDASCDTRTKLILAGEYLFGRHGIDGVPLHEVVAAAGQRNASALNYHIGGREELLTAIIDFRRSSVDARRVALLDEYVAAGMTMDETAIAAGIILPLGELMLRDPNGGNYLLLLSQVFVTDRPHAAYFAFGRFDKGLRRCRRLYRVRFPNRPARLLNERFSTCSRSAMYALGDWERDKVTPRGVFARSSLAHFLADLVAVTASGLSSIDAREHPFRPFGAIQPAARQLDMAGPG
jgi:AcrR family transcriptional regulator